MKTKEELPECPVATTVQLIGSKWKLLIMRNLLVRPWRFNELKANLEGISQKVLTDSLRSMEEDGKVSIRNIRREAIDDIEKSEDSEDIQKNLTNKVQDLVNKYNKLIEDKTKIKEDELMTV